VKESTKDKIADWFIDFIEKDIREIKIAVTTLKKTTIFALKEDKKQLGRLLNKLRSKFRESLN